MLRDRFTTALGLIRVGLNVLRLKPSSRRTVADLIEAQAEALADRPCILYEDRRISFAEFNAAANRVAHWALRTGLQRGEVVALLMGNRPEFLVTWAGLAKLGVVSALINTNLIGRALRYALQTSEAKRLILGAECLDRYASLAGEVPSGGEIYISTAPGTTPELDQLPQGAQNLDATLAGCPTHNPDPRLREQLRAGDPLFYIYTSGTTGNPKAARFSHMRFLLSANLGGVAGYRPGDVVYCALPLYHTAGGVVVVGSAWSFGAAVAIRQRFSARHFWDDIRRYQATAFQYIGEFCRYLVNQPPSPRDREHRVRVAMGNGLRPDIWEEFRDRFGIRRIIEFYGSTEGNTGLVNLSGRVGSVGRLPPAVLSGSCLIAYDVAREIHPRSKLGFCIKCKADEVGELIGRIPRSKDSARGSFEGYTSVAETEKKILRNVFRSGDAWFRSGDLLRRDRRGDFYFVDRIGDTFRWKGENVSTQEVAEYCATFMGVEMANVYGVSVPGADGRAGMLGLSLAQPVKFDGRAFYGFARAGLASYATPVFVRLLGEAQLTGTFKLRKVDLQAQGFDPSVTRDRLFVRDDALEAYVPLTPARFARIQSAQHRL